METPQQRVATFWRDYDRFNKTWSLECTLIMRFGKHPELLLPGGEPYRSGNYGYDPCLSEPGTPDYEIIESFVNAAETVIEGRTPETGEGFLDKRLCGYPAGRRADTQALNLGWSQPFQRIEESEELKEGLIAELREVTLGKVQ